MKRALGKSHLLGAILLFLLIFASAPSARTEEGMWTFDNPPLKLWKDKYGFTPAPGWLDHIRQASVRFNDGGSGSFVSPNGLVLTNHHVALGQLQKMSTDKKDYVKDGFLARTAAQEIKCADLELNVLVSTENVTERVLAAVKKAPDEKKALEVRRAEIAKIEKDSLDATGFRSNVITLYSGGEYWLYRYKKYTDVRLVFAPENQIAFFGGDPDNFTYPRYDIDFTLFRVYENDKPVTSKHFLKWNSKGAAENDLVFVSGHPGSTDRMQTFAQLEFQRDLMYPWYFKYINRRLDVLRRYSARGAEQARQAMDQIFGLENGLKALTGEYNGLLDKALMEKKRKEENEFRAVIDKNAEWRKAYGKAWDETARAQRDLAGFFKPYMYQALRNSLSGFANQIVKYVAEVKKPDGERLPGYHDSELDELKFYLFSPAPIYPELEEAELGDGLQASLEELGANDPFIKTALNGKSPADAAKELVTKTKLSDPAVRKSLLEGGETAVAASQDPMIVLARALDPMSRTMRKRYENAVESVESAAGEKIGKARFSAYGKEASPDATFTLRLSFGAVKGY
ncbi:MAG: S46 family peptidase, partial [Candidatus Aminicenantes bacterium]|nr:S46 family peptidase [Candidatus Aminicenantes bacterium]